MDIHLHQHCLALLNVTCGVLLVQTAIVGFAVQALVTREGPIEGLQAHIADPFGHNIVTNLQRLPEVQGISYYA